MLSKLGKSCALLLLVVMTIGCDRVTKQLAAENLAGEPAHSYFADTFRLTYAENVGGFLSLGAGLPTTLRNAAMAMWLELLYERLQTSLDAELAGIAAKSLKEVRYHRQHSSDWVVRLGDGTAESKARIQAALNGLWPYFNELFAADGVDGVGPAWNELAPEWRARWATLMQEATLTLPRESAMQPRGIDGIHSEHMGHMLGTMQFLQRTYPGGVW